ncbi:hypothetical protein GQ43DRAFT_51913 [Delitschia confertaspora ATCC 74209]|uniref:Transcription factor TFIIIC triple barrel domain-containing protein n=1 Tax=Delitschia confertaspora ATCC 74209 TaxID=1513339 RepID=A0A9P4JT27_9PLEO|nr:hypothetical protein GQ43DRAFT_51913 [Delitschia confertaspora ATCC 74209]
MDNHEDEDWEYEYDETETEDFYINVDLSQVPDRGDSSVSAQFVARDIGGRRSVLLHNRMREFHASDGSHTAKQPVSEQEVIGAMQITGLHTVNPLAVYNGKLLSLNWASTIGSELYFIRSIEHEQSAHEPLRPLPSVNLLAVCSTKLTATAAQFHPKASTYDNAQVNGDIAEETVEASEAGQTRFQEKSNFLSRLNTVKARRGEDTNLFIRRNADGPSLTTNSGHRGRRYDTTDEEY